MRSALALVARWAASADAASWLEKNFWLSGPRYDAVVPVCEDPAVLGKIQARFAEKERKFWQSNLQILGFERVRETAFRPWARARRTPSRAASAAASRWCPTRARAAIHYWIGEDTGMIGATWGVEWCVVGLDRNWAYNPGCRMAQP